MDGPKEVCTRIVRAARDRKLTTEEMEELKRAFEATKDDDLVLAAWVGISAPTGRRPDEEHVYVNVKTIHPLIVTRTLEAIASSRKDDFSSIHALVRELEGLDGDQEVG